LACLLAQGEHFQRQRTEAPIFLLDDFAAELDRRHQGRLLQVLGDNAWQVIATGTEVPDGFERWGHAAFRMEQGCIRPGAA
jgi:DNA replication and repair protein RecF